MHIGLLIGSFYADLIGKNQKLYCLANCQEILSVKLLGFFQYFRNIAISFSTSYSSLLFKKLNNIFYSERQVLLVNPSSSSLSSFHYDNVLSGIRKPICAFRIGKFACL